MVAQNPTSLAEVDRNIEHWRGREPGPSWCVSFFLLILLSFIFYIALILPRDLAQDLEEASLFQLHPFFSNTSPFDEQIPTYTETMEVQVEVEEFVMDR